MSEVVVVLATRRPSITISSPSMNSVEIALFLHELFVIEGRF